MARDAQGRPDHADFWALADACSKNDDEAEVQRRSLDKLLGRWVDIESLGYVVNQRVMRVLLYGKGRANNTKEQVATATWIDGFATAMRMVEERQPKDGQHRA